MRIGQRDLRGAREIRGGSVLAPKITYARGLKSRRAGTLAALDSIRIGRIDESRRCAIDLAATN